MEEQDWDFPGIDDDSLQVVEKLTEQKVNRTLSALEIAMSAWEGAGNKPSGLEDDYKKMKWLHAELTQWAKASIREIHKADVESRLKRLRRFYKICKGFQSFT